MFSLKFICFFIALFFCTTSLATTVKLKWGIREDLVYFKKQALAFKHDIEKSTQKKIQIEIISYPEADEKKIHPATEFLNLGQYDIVQDMTGSLESLTSELKVWNLPFLFSSYEQLEKYMANTGKQTLDKLETATMKPIDYSYSGGFIVIAGKKIDSFIDLKKQKIPLVVEEGNLLHEKFLHDLGIATITERANNAHGFSEHILAVGDEIASSNDVGSMHVNLSYHRVIARIVFVSKKKLHSMGQKNEKLFTEKLKKYLYHERQDSIDGQQIILSLLKNRGATIHEWSQSQKMENKKVFQTHYDEFEKENPGYLTKIYSVLETLAKKQ